MADYSKPLYEITTAGATMIITYDNLIQCEGVWEDQTTRAKIATMDIEDEMLIGDGSGGIIKLKRIA
jgi:hypothetical protein